MMGCGLLLTRFLLLIRIDRWLSGGYNRIELRKIRDLAEFYDLFIGLAIQHYQRVSRDAMNRIAALKAFEKNGYK